MSDDKIDKSFIAQTLIIGIPASVVVSVFATGLLWMAVNVFGYAFVGYWVWDGDDDSLLRVSCTIALVIYVSANSWVWKEYKKQKFQDEADSLFKRFK